MHFHFIPSSDSDITQMKFLICTEDKNPFNLHRTTNMAADGLTVQRVIASATKLVMCLACLIYC